MTVCGGDDRGRKLCDVCTGKSLSKKSTGGNGSSNTPIAVIIILQDVDIALKHNTDKVDSTTAVADRFFFFIISGVCFQFFENTGQFCLWNSLK